MSNLARLLRKMVLHSSLKGRINTYACTVLIQTRLERERQNIYQMRSWVLKHMKFPKYWMSIKYCMKHKACQELYCIVFFNEHSFIYKLFHYIMETSLFLKFTLNQSNIYVWIISCDVCLISFHMTYDFVIIVVLEMYSLNSKIIKFEHVNNCMLLFIDRSS